MIGENMHPIRVVARKTGLSTFIIRAWEKRYNAVEPQRTDTNRRLYTDEDIEKLSLLRDATKAGYRIGEIADLSIEQLREMVSDLKFAEPSAADKSRPKPSTPRARDYVDRCLEAISRFDNVELEDLLAQTVIDMGELATLDNVVIPLLHEIGDRWERGDFRTAQEHMASAVLRTFVGNLISTHTVSKSAPHICVTTPAGQLHENGALIAAAVASAHGWRVTYLGPNLGAEEIAGAARTKGSRAVALSIIYPVDDPHMNNELTKLRKFLGDDIELIVGGFGAPHYDQAIEKADSKYLRNISEFASVLQKIRE